MKPKKKFGTVYKITCIITGLIYIGFTTQPLEERLRQHLNGAFYEYRTGYNSRFYVAIREFGKDAFIIEPLDENIPESQLRDLERQRINELHTNNPAIGYNFQDGRFLSDKNAYARAKYDNLSPEKKKARSQTHTEYMRGYRGAHRKEINARSRSRYHNMSPEEKKERNRRSNMSRKSKRKPKLI